MVDKQSEGQDKYEVEAQAQEKAQSRSGFLPIICYPIQLSPSSSSYDDAQPSASSKRSSNGGRGTPSVDNALNQLSRNPSLLRQLSSTSRHSNSSSVHHISSSRPRTPTYQSRHDRALPAASFEGDPTQFNRSRFSAGSARLSPFPSYEGQKVQQKKSKFIKLAIIVGACIAVCSAIAVYFVSNANKAVEQKMGVLFNDEPRDTDKDGISDELEFNVGLNPNNPDTDFDGIGDADEVANIMNAYYALTAEAEAEAENSKAGKTLAPTLAKSAKIPKTKAPSIVGTNTKVGKTQAPSTENPSSSPTSSLNPSSSPTRSPTSSPTSSPSVRPSFSPSVNPSSFPSSSQSPSSKPSPSPSVRPSSKPSMSPSSKPSPSPSVIPSSKPSMSPSSKPSSSPSVVPSSKPSVSSHPSVSPSRAPVTSSPTQAPTRSTPPTAPPTQAPTRSEPPTAPPTEAPTRSTPPTAPPTQAPTRSEPPTAPPTEAPTRSEPPTAPPTEAPTRSNPPTAPPTQTPTRSEPPTAPPTEAPTRSEPPTAPPTEAPTRSEPPTAPPTEAPTRFTAGLSSLVKREPLPSTIYGRLSTDETSSCYLNRFLPLILDNDFAACSQYWSFKSAFGRVQASSSCNGGMCLAMGDTPSCMVLEGVNNDESVLVRSSVAWDWSSFTEPVAAPNSGACATILTDSSIDLVAANASTGGAPGFGTGKIGTTGQCYSSSGRTINPGISTVTSSITFNINSKEYKCKVVEGGSVCKMWGYNNGYGSNIDSQYIPFSCPDIEGDAYEGYITRAINHYNLSPVTEGVGHAPNVVLHKV